MRYDITLNGLKRDGYRPLHAGDDYRYGMTLYDADGNPIDLTGAEIWFTVKRAQADSDADAKLQLTSEAGIEIDVDPTTGKFALCFTAEDTADLFGIWWYDLQVKGEIDEEPDKVVTPLWGRIEFGPNITQTTTIPTPPP